MRPRKVLKLPADDQNVIKIPYTTPIRRSLVRSDYELPFNQHILKNSLERTRGYSTTSKQYEKNYSVEYQSIGRVFEFPMNVPGYLRVYPILCNRMCYFLIAIRTPANLTFLQVSIMPKRPLMKDEASKPQ